MNGPLTIAVAVGRYVEHLAVKNCSKTYQHNQLRELGVFVRWCEERGVFTVHDVTRAVVERYQRWLFYLRKANGKPLGVRTQYMRVGSVKLLFRWVTRQDFLQHNPASEIELPKQGHRLPTEVLSVKEVETLLAAPDVNEVLGLRDRAMLEVLYATGVRRRELLGLHVVDVHRDREALGVRRGKGDRDRVVPLGERALKWVEKYLDDARGNLVVGPDEGTLFLSVTGGSIHPDYLTTLVRRYVVSSLGKKGSCHLLRHSMATAMLENGADIRFIQAMLGHANLTSTEIYTHVSVAKLREIHAATHPTARFGRAPKPVMDRVAADEAAELLSSESPEDDDSTAAP